MACSKTDLSASVNDFTFDIYKHIVSAQPSDNAFMSTTSIMVVMAMLHIGARNNTEKQMAEVLKLGDMDRESLLREVERFVEILKEGSRAVNLKTANRLYPHIQKPILEDYIKRVRQHFSAEVKSLDYTTKAEESRLEINAWVEKETNGKIKDLLPSGSITPLTAMVVVNAIYFKGNWNKQFNPDETRKANFYTPSITQVDMMGKEFDKVKYTESEDLACKALELPYIGGELGMVILLPNDKVGLSALEKQLSHAVVQALMSKMYERKVIVNMPKFKLEASYEIKDVLSSLGMTDLFDGAKADLSGMGTDLFVSQVFHKAFVDVNEEGTEAAAATAGIMLLGCAMGARPTTFIADHPFLFMIWDHRLDVPLFIGRLANPKV